MGNWENGHMDDGWGVVMMLGMTAFWVAIIALAVFTIVWACRANRSSEPASSGPPTRGANWDPGAGGVSGSVTRTAEQILAERLARGEIHAEEYRARLDALAPRSEQ